MLKTAALLVNLVLPTLMDEDSAARLHIDPDRLAVEMATDEDVVRVLRQNGDVATIVRPIEVRFEGSQSAIARLHSAISDFGWHVLQVVDLDDGTVALDVQRDQSTQPAAIRALTEDALRIELIFGVEYDGWGTMAKTGK